MVAFLVPINKGVPDVNTFDYQEWHSDHECDGTFELPPLVWIADIARRRPAVRNRRRERRDTGGGSGTPEIYTPGQGWTALPGAYSADIATQLVLSARLDVQQRHNFWLLSMGTGENAGTIFTIDTAGRGSVTNLGHTPFESVSYDPAAMFAEDKILTIDKYGNAWIMDISGATPTFTQTGNVGSNRAWSNLTDLADGTVLLTGGSNGLGPSGYGNVATETNNADDLEPRNRRMDQ